MICYMKECCVVQLETSLSRTMRTDYCIFGPTHGAEALPSVMINSLEKKQMMTD